jgi:hypothetical protein
MIVDCMDVCQLDCKRYIACFAVNIGLQYVTTLLTREGVSAPCVKSSPFGI